MRTERAPVLRADRQGIALLLVVMLTVLVAAIAAGAALIGANSFLISEYDQRLSLLESVADAGLERVRAELNANPSLFHDTMTTIESSVSVRDALGQVIPNVTRSVYVGPVGQGPGEYGSYGAIVAVAEDADGARVVRRLDLEQETFAKYIYFTDYEPSDIWFGSNDILKGPVHTNSDIKVRASGATFEGDVTASGVFQFEDPSTVTFLADTASDVPTIPMPTLSKLTAMASRAQTGHLEFDADPASYGQAFLRLEFLTITIDGSPRGFVRAYRAAGITGADAEWVTSNKPSGSSVIPSNSVSCGDFHSGVFESAYDHSAGTLGHTSGDALIASGSRCFLGGDPTLTNGFTASTTLGAWESYVAHGGTVHSSVSAVRADADYLFPLDRELNDGYRGVIYVDDDVVISGTVRGRVTLVTPGDIVIGDDLTYAGVPGSDCSDMLGLLAGGDIVIADNQINTPQQVTSGGQYRTYDDTQSETVHGVSMALNLFGVQNHNSGPNVSWSSPQTNEVCEGTAWGRGCLYVIGGIIQATRGAVGTSYGHGHKKRYSYDVCADDSPPPYFPTTGHFWRTRYYMVNPQGFQPKAYFEALN